jgi:hypothetical protein
MKGMGVIKSVAREEAWSAITPTILWTSHDHEDSAEGKEDKVRAGRGGGGSSNCFPYASEGYAI